MSKYIVIFLLISALFSSCEKEIDLKLKDTEPQFVIAAIINANDSNNVVRISKTVGFNEKNDFPMVSNASVIVVDNIGNTFVFIESEPGVYINKTTSFQEGRTYRITVKSEDKTFEATGTIPEMVPLLSIEYLPNQFFGDKGFLLLPIFEDPAGVRNFYTFQYKDLKMVERFSRLIYREDDVTDGQFNQQPLFEGFGVEIGDSIELQMNGIDQEMYTYYFSKDQNTSPNSGAPANPVTNWSNNALGYFAARNQQIITFVVQ